MKNNYIFLLIGWAGIINQAWVIYLGSPGDLFLIPTIIVLSSFIVGVFFASIDLKKAKAEFIEGVRGSAIRLGLLTEEESIEKIKNMDDAFNYSTNIMRHIVKKLEEESD